MSLAFCVGTGDAVQITVIRHAGHEHAAWTLTTTAPWQAGAVDAGVIGRTAVTAHAEREAAFPAAPRSVRAAAAPVAADLVRGAMSVSATALAGQAPSPAGAGLLRAPAAPLHATRSPATSSTAPGSATTAQPAAGPSPGRRGRCGACPCQESRGHSDQVGQNIPAGVRGTESSNEPVERHWCQRWLLLPDLGARFAAFRRMGDQNGLIQAIAFGTR